MPSNRRNEMIAKNAGSGVRQRSRKDERLIEMPQLATPTTENKDVLKNNLLWKRQPSPSFSVVSIALLSYSAIFALQLFMENYYLPTPLLLSDVPDHPEQFIAERAMARLLKLTQLGPRVSGSEANEILAVDVLKSEVQAIMANAHPSKTVELDLQRVSGSYPLRFLDGLTNYYRNVPNVVVRLSSSPNWPHSLLINCHFDSVPDSPGGSDDGASCANMLEILQVLSSSPRPLKHNIIFLFNGAEENLMHASHGFITQHRWAKQVRAFVNLEACGAGGREVLFQSGPNSPWIMETYANTVPRPYASSMAQEIFESGIVPGDTDFRVFRDFGNVSGLDFAWSTNGYVYHTKFDNADQIPLGTLQRTGENVLELVKGLANAPQLAQPEKYRPGNLVYFDVLGLVVIRWSETVANLLNVSAVILSIATVALNRRTFERQNVKLRYYRELWKAFAVVSASAVLVTAVCLANASFLASVGRSMSWYGRPGWLLFLYVIPSITTIMAAQLFAARWQLKAVKSKVFLVQIYYDVYQVIWTITLIIGIAFQIRSACLSWLWVVSPALASLAHRFLNHFNKGEPGRGYLIVFLTGLAGPVLQFSGMQIAILSLFIPIMGRVGSSLNPDLVVGMYTSHTFAMLYSYASPLVLLEKRPGRLLKIMAGISFAAIFVLAISDFGFPYSADPSAPKPQRYLFVHTERVYHNYSREVNRQTGYWIIDFDYNTPDFVKPFVSEVRNAQEVDDCDDWLYCGLPYLMPALSLVRKTHWIPGPAPRLSPSPELKLISRAFFPDNKTLRLNFRATGPDHMGLMVSPRADVGFAGWSISAAPPVAGPQWQNRDTYFVYYADAQNSGPWIFHIDLLPDPSRLKQPMLDIALTGHHLHGPHQRSRSFQTVVDSFPDWTAVMAWTASYKSHIY